MRPVAGLPDGGVTPSRQALVGTVLAALIVSAWLGLHIRNVFFHAWDGVGFWISVPLALLQCWLNVGLFIVAHDAMHGSLAPFRPGVNRAFGRLALILYAGFSFDELIGKHFAHHRNPGSADDPDFSENHPDAFWPWYLEFFRQYFGWREFFTIGSVVTAYLLALGAHPANVIVFFALPAILSSLQLFAFGTYLPHRREKTGFADRHNARSNEYSWLMSLLTCFHFGYHHQHHLRPDLPWWRLPAARRVGDAAASRAAVGEGPLGGASRP